MHKEKDIKEFSAAGSVAGFQAPLGIRKRKKKVDEMLETVKDLSMEDVILFVKDIKDADIVDVEEMLDKSLFSELAEKIKNSCLETRLREVIKSKIKEVVRKTADGSYVLYSPNPGKGQKAKSIARFGSKIAAKRAQLSRFPPKDPEKLKRLKDEIEQLEKNPDKDKEKPWLQQHTHQKGKKKKGKKKESVLNNEHIDMLAAVIVESMFREEKAKSDWDEYVSRLSKGAVESDTKFARLQGSIDQKSGLALKSAFDVLSKGLKRKQFITKIGGDVSKDERTGNIGVNFSVQDKESKASVGPFTIMVDNGVLRIEPTETARNSMVNLSPDRSKLFRAELITIQDDHFDKIGSDIDREIEKRDKYLSSLESKLDKFMSGLTPLEITMLKNLIVSKYRKLG